MNIIAPAPLLQGKEVSGPISARINLDGREYLNFFGAGYLALSGVAEIRKVIAKALEEGVPLSQQVPAAAVGGTDHIFDSVEKAAASACATEAAVYFASGYFIGAVGLASIDHPFDIVLIDEYAHYNLVDAAKLSGCQTYTFSHGDPSSLSDLLSKHAGRAHRPLVLTDGVFATTGRVPPLADYVQVLEKYGGHLLVDESHGFGVVGENGRGAAEFCGVSRSAVVGSTLSKALCTQGAFVACSSVASRRVRAIPPLRGANAGSPLSAAAACESLRYVLSHPQLRDDLSKKTKYLRGRLREVGFDIIDSPAPIVSFVAGSRNEMVGLQRRMFDEGIFLHYSTYMGAGTEGMLRCAVFSDHSRDDIDSLCQALARCT
jgi:8-amino-7-oxononanoate synthase